MRCKAYLPDFALAFEHFCIHTGGRGVLDELQKQLKLSPEAMAPSRAALWRCNPMPSPAQQCTAGHIKQLGCSISAITFLSNSAMRWRLALRNILACGMVMS